MSVTVRPGFYLLDHRPVRQQFYPQRLVPLTGGVAVHTTEGVLDRQDADMGAENTASYMTRRTDAGSYHELVDRDSVVPLVPDSYTAFHVATSGYNSRTWGISIAARTTDLSASDETTFALIGTVGARIAAFWRRQLIDPRKAARWVGGGAYNGPGLFCHGDVQPSDRSDAWARHPDCKTFDRWLVDAIHDHADPDSSEEDPPMATSTMLAWDGRTGKRYRIDGAVATVITEDSYKALNAWPWQVPDIGQIPPELLDSCTEVTSIGKLHDPEG